MILGRLVSGTSLLSLLGSVGACTATVTTGGGGASCSIDSAVAGCAGNASGYSCTGGDVPQQSNRALSCSVGTAGPGGVLLYCCVNAAFSPNTCGPDATVTGCVSSSIGFSCSGSNRPEQTDGSLVCSAAAPGPAGSTLYCCNTGGGTAPAPTDCAPDANVACANADTTGYTCPNGLTPSAPLRCGSGVPESGGGMGYCCASATTTPAACTQDANVACTTAGATGYTCPSGLAPPAPLRCGGGVPESGGALGYCCAPGTGVSSTCGPNSAITCATGFTGYSCSGQDTPWQTTPSLLCQPSTTMGAGGYCCVSSANSCVQAPAIVDCPPPYYGVTCSGGDMATAATPLLLCAADPNGGVMDFCCSPR